MDRAERAEGGLGGEDGEPVDALGFPFLFSLIPLADLFSTLYPGREPGKTSTKGK